MELYNGVVEFKSSRNEHLGMGFFADDKHLITCKHIFNGTEFGWDQIYGNKKQEFIDFAKRKFNLDWDGTAEITTKIANDDSVIELFAGTNRLSLKINLQKTEVAFEINDNHVWTFKAEFSKNSKKIYYNKYVNNDDVTAFYGEGGNSITAKINDLSQSLDLASLIINGSKPSNVEPIRLDARDYSDMSNLDVVMRSVVNKEVIQIKGRTDPSPDEDKYIVSSFQESNKNIQEGISGSLVMDAKNSSFIGMVSHIIPQQQCHVIPAKKIIKFCEVQNIYLMKKYLDWNAQAKSIVNDLFSEYGKSLPSKFSTGHKSLLLEEAASMRVSLQNVNIFRYFFRHLGLLTTNEINILNKLCMFVMDQWEKTRIMNKSSVYINRNYSACDDTHSILVEEMIFKILIREMGDKDPKDIIDSWEKMKYDDKEDDIKSKFSDLIENNKIKHEELFALIASAWLHDTGMIPMQKESDEDYRSRLNRHHLLSEEFIHANSTKLGLDGYLQKDELKRICSSHRHKDYLSLKNLSENFKSSPIKPDLICAYLRLADALQIPRNICIESGMILEFKDPYSRYQWLKSNFVREVRTTAKEHNVYLKIRKLKTSGKRGEKHLIVLKEILKRELLNELNSINIIFMNNNLNFYTLVDFLPEAVTSDGVDISEYDDLLSSIELFDPTISPTSSTIMGIVLDQILRILNYNSSNNKFYPIDKDKSLKLLGGYINVLDDIVNTRQCHIPIKKLDSFLHNAIKLLPVGEDIKVLKEDIDTIFENITETILNLVSFRKLLKERLPEVALPLIIDGSPILLYGYSRCIIETFRLIFDRYKEHKDLINRLRDMPIYICEASTKNEYGYNNMLIYNDAINYIESLKSLDNDGFTNIYYIPDLCAANLFSKNMVSKVLFGANGIGVDGCVHHTLGHLAIAEMASKYQVPLYIIADSSKIGIVEADPENQRGNSWLTTDIIKGNTICREGVNSYNPRGDCVPPNLIAAIITEKGIIKPSSIRNHIDYKVNIYKDIQNDLKDEIKSLSVFMQNPHINNPKYPFESLKIVINEAEIYLYRRIMSKNKSQEIHMAAEDRLIKVDYIIDEKEQQIYIISISTRADEEWHSSKSYLSRIEELLLNKDRFESLRIQHDEAMNIMQKESRNNL